jgi:hypothetical protein
MQKLRLMAAGSLLALSLVGASMPAHAALFEGSVDEACRGTSLDGSPGHCEEEQATRKINHAVAQGIEIFSFVIGVIAVIMIIISAIRFVTSGGDPSTVNSAKNSIIYSIVGLVIAVLAQVIVRFVLTKL